jgi:hypothetical protein
MFVQDLPRLSINVDVVHSLRLRLRQVELDVNALHRMAAWNPSQRGSPGVLDRRSPQTVHHSSRFSLPHSLHYLRKAALVTNRNRFGPRHNAGHDAWNYTTGCPTGRFPDIRARIIVLTATV